jgi:hypothetical protein
MFSGGLFCFWELFTGKKDSKSKTIAKKIL